MAMFRSGPGLPFPTGANPVSNATADLNGDGHLDLLVTNYITDNVSVLLGDGNGRFTPTAAPVPVGNGPREIEAGDLDGDGDIDFIATNYSGNSVSVLLNNGSAASQRPRPSRSEPCRETSRWAISTATAISTSSPPTTNRTPSR